VTTKGERLLPPLQGHSEPWDGPVISRLVQIEDLHRSSGGPRIPLEP